MKKIVFLSILLFPILMILSSSCNDQPDSPSEDSTESPSDGQSANADPWAKYEDKHFTCSSLDFYWTELDSYDKQTLRKTKIADGEFVEFYDRSDTEIYIRYGCERPKYYNLVDTTGTSILAKILCPYSPFFFYKYVEAPLKFGYKTKYYYSFSGQGGVGKGVKIGFHGELSSNLQIFKDIEYSYDDLKMKEPGYFSQTMNWSCFEYSFDTKSLKSIISPIIIDWHTSEWKGEIAELIENPSDFLQLMLAMPILKNYPYGIYDVELDDYISIEFMIRTLFCGFENSWLKNKIADFYYLNYKGVYTYYSPDTFVFTQTDEGVIKFAIDSSKIFNDEMRKAKGRYLFLANCIMSLLSEDKCDFDMRYEIVDAQSSGNKTERELNLTLKDTQVSRNIMENLIMPLLIENKQRIKDFLLSDDRFAPHGEVLCRAVDRLEEIYAGTTDLTLGYKMMEHATNYFSFYGKAYTIWGTPEFK